MQKISGLIIILSFAIMLPCYGDETSVATDEAQATKKAREQFVELVNAFDRQFRRRMVEFENLAATDPANAHRKLRAELNEKGILLVEQEALLLFEEQHRPHHLGLMALRKIITHSHRYATAPEGVRQAKSRALKRLVHYASLPVLSDTLNACVGDGTSILGYPDAEVGDALRAVIEAKGVSRFVLPAAQLKLSDWILTFEPMVRHAAIQQKRLIELKTATSPEDAQLRDVLQAIRAAAPDEKTFAQWKPEALAILETLQETATNVRFPAVKTAGHRNIVRIDHEATKTKPTIAELAENRLKARAAKVEAGEK